MQSCVRSWCGSMGWWRSSTPASRTCRRLSRGRYAVLPHAVFASLCILVQVAGNKLTLLRPVSNWSPAEGNFNHQASEATLVHCKWPASYVKAAAHKSTSAKVSSGSSSSNRQPMQGCCKHCWVRLKDTQGVTAVSAAQLRCVFCSPGGDVSRSGAGRQRHV